MSIEPPPLRHDDRFPDDQPRSTYRASTIVGGVLLAVGIVVAVALVVRSGSSGYNAAIEKRIKDRAPGDHWRIDEWEEESLTAEDGTVRPPGKAIDARNG